MNFSKTAVVCVAALAAIALAGCQDKSTGQPATAASTHAATAATSSGPAAQGTTPSATQSSAATPVALPSFSADTGPFEIEKDLNKILDILTSSAVGIPDDLRHPNVKSVGQEVCGVSNVWPASACAEGDPNNPNGKYALFISVENARNQFKLGGHDMPGVYDSLAMAYTLYVASVRLQRVNPKLLTLGNLTDAETTMRTKAIVCTFGEVYGGMRKAGMPLTYGEQMRSNQVNSAFYREGAAGKPCI